MSTSSYVHFPTERDKLRDIAHALIRKEISEGRLLPPKQRSCVDCGSRAYCYDHRDYYRPLQVEPVCHACNNRRGPGLPLPERTDNASVKLGRQGTAGTLWSSVDSGGEGFEPLAAHLNGITAQDLERLAEVQENVVSIEESKKRIDHFEANRRLVHRRGRGRGKGSTNVTGIARAEWFKRRDPWFA